MNIETIEINIENMIYEIRGKQVILDSDVAHLFGYETKNLNRQVKRNIDRFPEEYCFKITKDEFLNLKCQNVTSSLKEEYGGRRYLPYAFTEYGITMLAGILKSEIAIKMSIRIVNTFINMRKYIIDKYYIYHCGASVNHAGSKTFSINILEDNLVKECLINKVNDLTFNK